MSMARPRLTCRGFLIAGLPSISVYDQFIEGIALIAWTMAKPIRWVKDTFPPRLRFRWLLMTIRLSIRSLAGTARTEVAVGTSRLVSMLVTTRAWAPRSGSITSPLSLAAPVAGCRSAVGLAGCGGAALAGAGRAGCGAGGGTDCAGAAGVPSAAGCSVAG